MPRQPREIRTSEEVLQEVGDEREVTRLLETWWWVEDYDTELRTIQFNNQPVADEYALEKLLGGTDATRTILTRLMRRAQDEYNAGG